MGKVKIKIFAKNLTLGGHTFQDGQRGSEELKRVLSSEFQAPKP